MGPAFADESEQWPGLIQRYTGTLLFNSWKQKKANFERTYLDLCILKCRGFGDYMWVTMLMTWGFKRPEMFWLQTRLGQLFTRFAGSLKNLSLSLFSHFHYSPPPPLSFLHLPGFSYFSPLFCSMLSSCFKIQNSSSCSRKKSKPFNAVNKEICLWRMKTGEAEAENYSGKNLSYTPAINILWENELTYFNFTLALLCLLVFANTSENLSITLAFHQIYPWN